jgi:RimJ/RimL family protein N-acetyltransferase
MVLGGQPPGRVGRRRILHTAGGLATSGRFRLRHLYDDRVELRDGELLLRPPAERDIPAVVAACQDPEISRFIPFVPTPYREDDAQAWLRAVSETWNASLERTFAILDEERDQFLGVVTVRLVEEGTVGYWLAPAARGRGVMTRAVRLVVDWVREMHAIRVLRLTTHPENTASQRVAERAGFRRVGLTRDHPAFRDGTHEAVLFELS